jgi:2-succinyl-6-hydroxy-2,4-cyclohexadiene-1-carboxylate synthase
MDTKMIKANDISLRYLDIQNEGKDTIIFLHYGGSTLGVWNGVIPHFKKNYRIIAFDLRCHGFSDKPTDKCHMDDMAADAAAIMDKLGIARAFIVGSSLGADTAISLAANYPDKVIAMALDGGLYDIVGPDSKDGITSEEEIKKKQDDLKNRIFSRPVTLYDSKEDFINTQKESWEKHFPWSDVIQKATEDEIFETEDGKFRTPQTPEEIWSYIEPLYDVRFQDYFDKITCPILWLPDEKEAPNEVVQRNIKKYAKNIKYFKVVTIEGSVHAYTCLLKPVELSTEINTFFDEVKGL